MLKVFKYPQYLGFFCKNAYDDEKRNKNTTQYVLDTTICKQTQIT